jgi:hypothetical protein
MEIEVQDQGTLPGIDDVVANLGSGPVDPAFLSKAKDAIQQAGIPLPATMGLWDNFASLIGWSRGKRLIRELSEITVPFPWFECHVPHSGTAQIRFESSHIDKSSIGFRVFGSGYDKGRSLKLTVSEESQPRSHCTNYLLDLRIVPRIYALKEKESLIIEVAGHAGTRTITLDECPYCIVTPESLDPFENILEPYIDIRQDNVRRAQKLRLDWSNNQTVEVGVKPPGLDATFTLTAQSLSDAVWEVTYEIEPGYFYQPYRRHSMGRFQPPMWAFKK